MIAWNAQKIADASGAWLVQVAAVADAEASRPGPTRAVIDSSHAAAGTLFVGLPGANVDGGQFAAQALEAGAWGVLVGPEHAAAVASTHRGVVLASEDPLKSLQQLASAWRRALGATVIGVTGSTGKTTTKELVAAMGRTVAATHATAGNFNTEIGLPLTILAAPAGTRLLVLEMAMRGPGQIAELARIASPEIGIVVNVGPAHLEQLGSIEAIAAEKGSLLDHLPERGTAIVPFGEPLLASHQRPGVAWITFGPGGDLPEEDLPELLGLSGKPAHIRLDATAALAAVRAAGLQPIGPIDELPGAGRGVVHQGVASSTIIDDCYNANPMSMRAALADLALRSGGRRVAVLGDMLELGPREAELHRELGGLANAAGVGLLVTVGRRAEAAGAQFDGPVLHFQAADEAAEALPAKIQAGDAVLVKGSRGVGLEVVVAALQNAEER